MNDIALAGDSGAALAALSTQLPLARERFAPAGRVGLVIVDEVNGFATVGAGNLAPPEPNAQVARMVAETDRLARAFAARGMPIAAFLDTHQPGKPEPPYPPHCEAGTGEEDLVPELAWLEGEANATLIRKDCINGFVGAIDPASGRNRIIDWIGEHKLDTVLVVGICTDICVMDFVLTLLSARNHRLAPPLKDVVVYEPGCATYHLPRAAAKRLGLPESASHPQDVTHHMGLYFMHSRGARLAGEVAWAR
ncbi:MAG TPA: isochorismatase family protein [Alphaproteobacteria bacterium]